MTEPTAGLILADWPRMKAQAKAALAAANLQEWPVVTRRFPDGSIGDIWLGYAGSGPRQRGWVEVGVRLVGDGPPALVTTYTARVYREIDTGRWDWAVIGVTSTYAIALTIVVLEVLADRLQPKLLAAIEGVA